MSKLNQCSHLRLEEKKSDEIIKYKKEIAKRFIDLGYSIEWIPNLKPRIEIYLPQEQNELRALIKFERNSNRRLGNGCVSNLVIELRTENLDSTLRGLCSMERHRLYEYVERREQINRLKIWPINLEQYKNMRVLALKFYEDILREFK